MRYKIEVFSTEKFHPLSVVLHEVALSQELKVVVTDSDPYDAMTYFLNGKPIATEFVASYKKRLQVIQADLAGFCNALKEHTIFQIEENTMETQTLKADDKIYFIRHKADNQNPPSSESSIRDLLEHKRIAIFFDNEPFSTVTTEYFENKITQAEKKDKRYYVTYKSAIDFFKKISQEGGYIVTEYLDGEIEPINNNANNSVPKRVGTIISKVKKGSKVVPFGSCQVTLQLDNSFYHKIDYANCPVLLAIRPPFTTICEPTRRTYEVLINALIKNKNPDPKDEDYSANLMHPKMVEQMCVEYLRKHGVNMSKLDYCTLRPGKSLAIIDICGVMDDGKMLFAQVKNDEIKESAKEIFGDFVSNSSDSLKIIFAYKSKYKVDGKDNQALFSPLDSHISDAEKNVIWLDVNDIFNKFKNDKPEMLKKMIGIELEKLK